MKRNLTLVSMLMLLMMAVAGCGESDYETNAAQEKYRSVKVEEINTLTTDKYLNYTGSVQAVAQKNISFSTGGRLVESYVEEGDMVTEGQLLAVVDTGDLSLQMNSVNAQIASARTNVELQQTSLNYNQEELDRTQALYDAGAVPKSTLDAADLALRNSRLAYEGAVENMNVLVAQRQRLSSMKDDGSVYADEAGIIEQVLVETSEMISPGQPAYILSAEGKHVLTYITREDYNIVEIGQTVNMDIEGVEGLGTVSYIDGSADPQTHTYKVEIDMNGVEVPGGSIARLSFVVGERTGIWIPIQSIQSSTIDYVYIVEDERTKRRAVQIKDLLGDLVMVDGLEEGDLLVTSGMKTLVDGILVKVEEGDSNE